MDHPIPVRRLDLELINKEKELLILWIMLFHWKIKEREKRDKYLDFVWELKN